MLAPHLPPSTRSDTDIVFKTLIDLKTKKKTRKKENKFKYNREGAVKRSINTLSNRARPCK